MTCGCTIGVLLGVGEGLLLGEFVGEGVLVGDPVGVGVGLFVGVGEAVFDGL